MELPVLRPVSPPILAPLPTTACTAGGASIKRTPDESDGASFERILVVAVAAR